MLTTTSVSGVHYIVSILNCFLVVAGTEYIHAVNLPLEQIMCRSFLPPTVPDPFQTHLPLDTSTTVATSVAMLHNYYLRQTA